ncbi:MULTISPECIES: sugar transferase [unclassified Meridianimarinicoccus]|uniref:sugar transferase n=1 Tax=unclassified Meridianimarinicoccus TaxID=2923344 RepID=UPI00299F8B76|nr:sugar transferase [Fluviibacterium sp. MJW13]
MIKGIVDYTPRKSFYRSFFKRVFDILFVLAASIVAVPVTVLLALMIMSDGGSPFFVQRRVGKDGKIFNMVKLRSMVVDADRKLAAFLSQNEEARDEWNRNQKLKSDPRITFVGRIIRKTSLDELPQFWNVLLGDMSVVGPRPMLPSQRDLYPGQAYYALKPGVTGLWQVGDRNNTSFAARARYDADYYRIVSLKTDICVVLKTVRVVLRGTGH